MDTGILVDVGDDILVFNSRNRYYYVPVKHLHHLRLNLSDQVTNRSLEENPIERATGDTISYRKTLFLARGLYVEIHITGVHTLNGYMTSIMNDYLVFFSPIFHTVYVSLEHLKAIVPYPVNMTPYLTDKEHFSVKPSGLTLARTFEQQLKKMEGHMVVLDLGDITGKIGLLRSVDKGMLCLVTAGGDVITWNVQHIKSAHLP